METKQHNGPVECPPPPGAAEHDLDVPPAVVRQFSPQTQEWAVFIFLYNEGAKLRHQLMRFPPDGKRSFDILVGDDGSNDDCASDQLMKDYGVTARVALLTNTGLSANMKAGLHWLLNQTNYRGVVFMNGNNKDDPEAISRFIDRIAAGYDYVQGSRFLLKSDSVDTPLIRRWAIRFLHAPLFSFAARRLMTDTTNGFRAFSLRFLRDPRVYIFQSCFQKYELEQYLAWKAIRLGFATCEIPVRRSYSTGPKGKLCHRADTKIRAGSGHLLMLKPLIELILGRYR
ncbi:MAG TPA: glycosyltransferase family 2 protein [Candidatus Udaeobacter sp.]|jgi:glycosyltransferase involved in cell wall biosynthesis|nr:glycosyltransferase family 2 protein [Candidatus Udaeobacter sp.]